MPTRGQMGIPHQQSDWDAVQDLRSHRATEEYIAKRDGLPRLTKEHGMVIDVSLSNKALYAGAEIEELKTPTAQAVGIVEKNISAILEEYRESQYSHVDAGETDVSGRPHPTPVPKPGAFDAVTLTGPMAVWAYLVVFHAVVYRFGRVYYDDGRSGPVVVAAHG